MGVREERSPGLGSAHDGVDSDPIETSEWIESLEAVVRGAGNERGLFLLQRLEEQAQQLGIITHVQPYSAYRNTIALENQGAYPGDLALEERITSIIRWNALAMVVRANLAYGELGGHIASYASAAEIFEAGFNHFFHAASDAHGGDLVFFQPHSAPGVYARAFLEGHLTEEHLANYRQELSGKGLCSYPHPWLMPDFWQFPTGSMGLGPISAIYQARFMRYLEHRGLADTGDRHVWGVFGDGEMDEPESSRGADVCNARAARQPDLRHQLQSAAPRRSGARQRTDHPGAGVALQRRRLERDQGAMGIGLGHSLCARRNPCAAARICRYAGW